MLGKSNILVTLNYISKILNKKNNDKYPVFEFIKIFQNSMDNKYIFNENKIQIAYQSNNNFLKNILELLNDTVFDINELNEYYRLMSLAIGEEKGNFNIMDNKKNQNNEESSKNSIDNINKLESDEKTLNENIDSLSKKNLEEEKNSK